MSGHSAWWRWRGKAPSAPATVETVAALAAAPEVVTARQAVALSHLLDAATLALGFLDETKGRVGYGYATADLLDGVMREAEAALGRRVRPARPARPDGDGGMQP